MRLLLTWYDPNENVQRDYEGTLPITLGRAPQNTIVLDSLRVSRQHAKIQKINGKLMLVDLKSNNGTGLNDKVLRDESLPLRDEDRVVIAPFDIRITILDEAPDSSPADADFKRQTSSFDLPSPLHLLSDIESALLQEFMQIKQYAPGELLFKQGDETDGAYLIDKGIVRLELDKPVDDDNDTDQSLALVDAHNFIGELSLLDRLPRSASAFAHTELVARKLSITAFDELVQAQPKIAFSLVMALGKAAALKLRGATKKLDELSRKKV